MQSKPNFETLADLAQTLVSQSTHGGRVKSIEFAIRELPVHDRIKALEAALLENSENYAGCYAPGSELIPALLKSRDLYHSTRFDLFTALSNAKEQL